MCDLTYTTSQATIGDMISWLKQFPEGTSLSPGLIEVGQTVGRVKDVVLKEYKVEFTFTAFQEVKSDGRK